jgi:hypothetical protein
VSVSRDTRHFAGCSDDKPQPVKAARSHDGFVAASPEVPRLVYFVNGLSHVRWVGGGPCQIGQVGLASHRRLAGRCASTPW